MVLFLLAQKSTKLRKNKKRRDLARKGVGHVILCFHHSAFQYDKQLKL